MSRSDLDHKGVLRSAGELNRVSGRSQDKLLEGKYRVGSQVVAEG